MQNQVASFYWHDYETWGLSPSLDRPSQFAGIRTDMDLNIIAEPEMFYCRLSDDYLPNPESVAITKISPRITQLEGLSESEFSKRIYAQFSQPNTCVVGYNNIRFDDEFSRHIFYRNFYDPYEYCWKNANSRWDIIDLIRAAYALRPKGINWPKNDNGLPSFRLELLTEANGISHEQAHDATSDVYATIALAKLVKQKAPKLFDYYFKLRNKNEVKALINCEQMEALVHVSGMFGAERSNASLVAPIIWHPTNTNAVVMVDLTQDVSPLFDLTADEIRDRLYTKKEFLNGNLPIPLKLLHINKCPFVAIEKTLLAENATRLNIDQQLCKKNQLLLKSHTKITRVLKEVFLPERIFDNKGNVDAMLYDGFFSYKDKTVFEKIRNVSATKLAEMVFSVSDKRFQDLFFRYRARNFPNTLNSEEKLKWKYYRQSLFKDNLTVYFKELDAYLVEYKSQADTYKALVDLQDYAKKIKLI